MTEKKRLVSVELLRIVAMVMVVVMHFLRESGALLSAEQTGSLTAEGVLATVLEAFCIGAVNAYVFISGYFGCESRFQPAKVITFLCQIWFYSLLIPLFLTCMGIPVTAKETGIYGLAQYVLPIETESYWFATAYFLLLLLMPVLNRAAEKMTKGQLQYTLFGLLLIFCGVKSICPIPLAFDRYGYDVLWFICVYLTAVYLKKYGAGIFERHAWLIYMGSSLLIAAMTLGGWLVLKNFQGAAYYFTVPFHYNFVFCLTGAIGLFYGFLKLNRKEGRTARLIRRAGSYSFGVYLLHEHPDVRYRWYPFLKGIINPSGKTGVGMLVTELIFSVAILFAAGLIIEFIRSLIFKGLRPFLNKKLERFQ